MRWNLPPTPIADGTTRWREQFAWRPTRLSDGSTVWLEWYHRHEEFVEHLGCYVLTDRSPCSCEVYF